MPRPIDAIAAMHPTAVRLPAHVVFENELIEFQIVGNPPGDHVIAHARNFEVASLASTMLALAAAADCARKRCRSISAGYTHRPGELCAHWLADVLATPAEHGTLLAVHHPPMPTPLLWAMEMLELHGQDRLERVIRGTDVRGILGGHLHYSGHSTFAGVPVSVAAATCYTLALTAKDRLLSGVNADQAMNLVHVYDDRLVHSVVPIGDRSEITGFSTEFVSRIESMTAEQRTEMFSKKTSTFNLGEEPRA